MQLFHHLEHFTNKKQPTILTIGTFDGVHRGHQALFRRVLELAAPNSHTMALTFSNHPAEILRPGEPVPLLCTLSHRIRLIEACGINSLLILPFTNYLAQHSALSFVEKLREYISFTHLVLGYDATLGRDRQGNRAFMKELGEEWGFNVYYLEEYRYEGNPLSSSRVRELLQNGDLARVETFLGRPYSIYSKWLINPQEKTKTVLLEVKDLCLPPPGDYSVHIKQLNSESTPGTARVKLYEKESILELVEGTNNLKNETEEIEVVFLID